jgi:hypothetical protein
MSIVEGFIFPERLISKVYTTEELDEFSFEKLQETFQSFKEDSSEFLSAFGRC